MPRSSDEFTDVLAARERFLRALAAEPGSKRALEERLDVSRSTVDRAIRDLQSESLVSYEDRQYHLTPAGRYGLHAYEETKTRLDALVDASDVLSELPNDTPLDADFVVGSEVVRTSPRTPDSVLSRLLESVRSADHVDGVAPVALTGYLEAFHEESTGGGASVRVLLQPELCDHLVSAHGDPLRVGIEHPGVRLERASVPFEFGLWLADDREAGVIVYTETGVKAILVNDRECAVTWARTQFERAAETATPVEETDAYAAR
jgi:predicted transcriptional regulator